MRDDWKEHLLEQIATGRSVRAICREDEGMPERSFVNRTIFDSARYDKHEDSFANQYARALQDRAEVFAEELVHIADTPQIGEIKTIKADGSVEVKQVDMIEHRRLQISTRQWIASRMNPKKYGDKLQHGGAEDLPPVKVDMTPTEAARQIAFALRNGLENKDA
jgi:hypothetical protein